MAIVYLATNRINGKRYVGVTSHSMAFRRRQHENSSNSKRVTCRYFHAAIKKYGPEAFDWIELLLCDSFEEALQYEIRIIAGIKPEYNLTPGGQGNAAKRGPLSPEQLLARREKMANYVVSAETRAKIANFNRGKKRDPEVGRKISAKRIGIKFSVEQLRNMSLAQIGKKASAETIEKRRQKAIGRPCSSEHREKIRATLKGRKRPPEVVAKMLETRAKTFAETAAKPWIELGISSRRWFARRKEAREAAHG